MAGTSRLDEIVDKVYETGYVHGDNTGDFTGLLEPAEAKEQIKLLMKETYSKALQAHFVDKTASSLDAAFDELVEAL